MNTLYNKPLVSIIVRTKDRPKLLKNAIQSISAQTHRPIEVILVNDGGCDLDIEELKIILQDVSLKYIRLETNMGRPRAGNVGIENATGEYIGFLDDDDEFYSTHVSTLVNILDKNDYKVSYSDAHIIYIDLDPESGEMITKDRKVFSSKDFSYSELIVDNYIPFICTLFSKEILKQFHGLDEGLEIYEDWDLLIRIAEFYPFYHVNKTTAMYKQWSDILQIAQSHEFATKAYETHLKIIEKHKKKFTPHILMGLINHTRTITSKEDLIVSLESTVQELESTIQELESTVQENVGTIASLESTVQELESTVQENVGTIASLESILREKESALTRIYSSHGWKFLLKYYKVRDALLPLNSKKRALVKSVVKAISNPAKIVKNFNIMNIRKFFYYLKNADPSLLEYKINKKLSTQHSDPIISDSLFEGIENDAVPAETNSVLLIRGHASMAENDYLSSRVNTLIRYLRELNYSVKLLNHDNNVEEFLKLNGHKFSFVLGIGTGYCFRYFPYIRAYVPHGKLIYHVMDLQDNNLSTELFNSSVADSVIVDTEFKKERLLQHNDTLQIEVVPDIGIRDFIEKTLKIPHKIEQLKEVIYEEKIVTSLQKESVEENTVVTRSKNSKISSILVIGIYLANQVNTIEHIVDRMNQSNNYRILQKWIALNGDAPSESVRAVTTMKSMNAFPKFVLLNKALSQEELDAYEYILICDDDILLPDNFLDTFLHLQEKHDFAAAQPARTHNSYIDHFFVERFDGLNARRTRFVEIGPLVSFRRDLFSLIFPFDESTPMGWGFDFVLPYIAEKHGFSIGIIDSTPVDHSIRKPMNNYIYEEAKEAMEKYLSKNPHLSRQEAFMILESYTD